MGLDKLLKSGIVRLNLTFALKILKKVLHNILCLQNMVVMATFSFLAYMWMI
jgi:hypothetical protein